MAGAARQLCAVLALLVVVSTQRVHAQGEEGEWTGSPGFAPDVEEDLAMAAAIDVSKPPKTCRPEILSKIDFGVATAAYQVGFWQQFTPSKAGQPPQ